MWVGSYQSLQKWNLLVLRWLHSIKTAWLWIGIVCPSDMHSRKRLFQWIAVCKFIYSRWFNTSVFISSSSSSSHRNAIFFSPWYGWIVAHLVLNNNHSLTWCNKIGFLKQEREDYHHWRLINQVFQYNLTFYKRQTPVNLDYNRHNLPNWTIKDTCLPI